MSKIPPCAKSQAGVSVLLIVSWLLLALFAIIIGYLVLNPSIVTKPATPQVETSQELTDTKNTWQPAIADSTQNTNPDTPAPISSYYEAVNRAAQSVVNIYTTQNTSGQIYANDPVLQQFLERYYGGGTPNQGSSLGSGVVVSKDGYIVTNAHVIAQADEITVAFNDGRKARAKVVGSDTDSDLAVIRVELDNLVPMAFRAEPIRVGDVALAIGNPFGVGQTVTQGIISATGRAGIGVSSFEDFIQTDAAINPGNSGGALVDANGALIGINTAIYSRSGGSMGIGFAIPTQIVERVMNALITTGKVSQGWLGIEIMPATDNPTSIESRTGAVVARVWQDGPAAKAGVQVGDTITAIDGTPIKDANALIGMVAQKSPNSTLSLTIVRQDKTLNLSAQLAERPNFDQQPAAQNQGTPQNIEQLQQLLQQLEQMRNSQQY
ncbi:serine protease DegS [Moraxella cuniculi DSM 21768]|uniref:Serine protease DegS n=1 Tax=Moraxella cuniculi DSM 21768 TaxID=1122245 RepID=A0A1N7EIJ8_9GAMM|nr:trypsin-like peptidase domain-containing protein [Moraxella cuniculi]OOS07249.1 serine protease [Moraxella cuniculi]SIR87973.1 serine protease DegS [Moraxella cuniculi DSM 21768]